MITSGSTADNNKDVIQKMTQDVTGKIYCDKGYLLNPSLFKKLFEKGKHIVTKIRSNMRNKLMDIEDKKMLKKRGVIESTGAILKEDLNVEHSRYRNPLTLILNVCAALIIYAMRPNKPSIFKKNLLKQEVWYEKNNECCVYSNAVA